MLHTETVEPRTRELLKKLMGKPYLSTFNLVGGTALALQIGHRKSIDLDLFSEQEFDRDLLLKHLEADFENIEVLVRMKGTLLRRIQNVKVDFLRFRYAQIRPLNIQDSIRLCTPEDIVPMKLDVVAGRGKKKDFSDIYFLLERMTLQEMLDLHHEKFNLSTLFHVIKSLTYFEDAKFDDDPIVFGKKVKWQHVKSRILNTVGKL